MDAHRRSVRPCPNPGATNLGPRRYQTPPSPRKPQCTNPDPTNHLVALGGTALRLFDDYGVDPFVELAPAESLYPDLATGEWARARNELFGELGLEPLRPDHEVQVMLYLHQRLIEDAAS